MTDDDYVAELRSYGMLSTNQAADRIEALTAERDCYRKAQAENDNAWAALWAILACETPNANATVTRMAHLARVCLKGENHE